MTQKIAAALGPAKGAVAVAETAGARRKAPANLQAYDYYLLGMQAHLRFTKDDETKALDLFERAIELDPQFARGYFGLGIVYNDFPQYGWADNGPAWFEKAKVALLASIALDPTNNRAYTMLGNVYFSLSEFDRGLAAYEQSFALNPNDPSLLMLYAEVLPALGRAKEGVETINRAFRLNPHHPDWYYNLVEPFYATGQTIKL